ncbi:MAG TPA: HepT-like ribonuclease domain-containing protein [Dehalococcoidia bacterium]|nr:HepT-like ribonuclease domain-containing protein [Dehalococcoidia bacterium]
MGYANCRPGSKVICAGQGYEAFIEDALLIHAIERELEIVGEAARRISDTYRTAHPEIPWRSIIGLRNVLAHDYANVDLTSL